MEDLLSMKMDQIGEPQKQQERSRGDERHVDPFDHFEVQCNKLETIYIGAELPAAEKVYGESQSQAKALIHVKGVAREVKTTNAPYVYQQGKLR